MEGFSAWRFETIRKRFSDKFQRLSSLPEGRAITFADAQAIENYYNIEILERLYTEYWVT